MKLLITGGCGFLGSNLAAHFLELGAEVVVVDALLRSGGEQNRDWLRSLAKSEKQLIIYNSDIADAAALEEVFIKHKPFDYICHVAGQVAMTTSLMDPRRDMLTNVVGTFNVLENTRRYSPEALVAYSSTNKVYGDLKHLTYVEAATRFTVPTAPNGFDESLPLDFASPYGCSKGSADQYMRDWHRNYGLRTVVFRHSSIYGGRQFATFDQGWIGWFCQQALKQTKAQARGGFVEKFTISGTGKQVRDVLHANDLVALYNKAYLNCSRCVGEIFNIGGGINNSLSLLELFALLENKICPERPLSYERLPRRQSDQDFFVADIRKASALIGWTPTCSASEGLDRMLEWSNKQCFTDS